MDSRLSLTSPIIGEIEKGVAGAADAGNLGRGEAQALKVVGDLKTKLGLSVSAGATPPSAKQTAPSGKPSGGFVYYINYKYVDKEGVAHYTDRLESIPKEYRDQTETIPEEVPQSSESPVSEESGEQVNNYSPNPSPEVINNYYYNEGPPIVTYYPPPDPYYYLYAWVPYPFWCSGFFFGGFFILHDFHRHIHFHDHVFVVTNHVVNVSSNKVFLVDPVSRNLGRSVTASRLASPQVFSSPRVESSAGTIVAHGHNRIVPSNVFKAPRVSNIPSASSPSRLEVQVRPSQETNMPGTMPITRGGMIPPPTVGSPRMEQRESNMSRNVGNRNEIGFKRPQASESRVFNPRFSSPLPASQGHASSVLSTGGGRGFFGGFHGGGGFGGHSGFSGGGFGGHR